MSREFYDDRDIVVTQTGTGFFRISKPRIGDSLNLDLRELRKRNRLELALEWGHSYSLDPGRGI